MKCLIFNFLIILQCAKFALCLKQLDIQPYIDKMEQKLENFATPSPEFVDEFLVQLQSSCKENVTMNPDMIPNFNTCMENVFNATTFIEEFRESIPKGDLDVVFRNLCLKWPIMKNCMKDGMDFLTQCWGDNKTMEQLNIGMDAAVQFFCGDENDGAKIACTGISLFFAEDGISCLEDHAEELSECLSEQLLMDSEKTGAATITAFPGDVCKAVNNLHQCITIFKRCLNVTPENLIHSLVKQIGKRMNCGTFPKSTYIYPEPKVIPSSSELVEEKKMTDSITGLIFNNFVAGKFKDQLGLLEENSECVKKLMDTTQQCSLHFTDLSFINKIQNVPFMCKRFLEWNAKCMNPHKELLKNCTTEGYTAVTLINDLCRRDNGTMVQEILDYGEKHCKSKESAIHWFNKCTKLHYEGKEQFLTLKSLSEDFCGTLSISRHCALETLTKCKNHKSLHQVQAFFKSIDTDPQPDDENLSKCLHKKLAFTGAGGTGIGYKSNQDWQFKMLVFVLSALIVLNT